jgi:hypothetical protein
MYRNVRFVDKIHAIGDAKYPNYPNSLEIQKVAPVQIYCHLLDRCGSRYEAGEVSVTGTVDGNSKIDLDKILRKIRVCHFDKNREINDEVKFKGPPQALQIE